MITIKKCSRFITFLLITFTFNAYSMEPIGSTSREEQELELGLTSTEQPQFNDYIMYINDIFTLLGYKQFALNEAASLQQLPPEIRNPMFNILLANNRTNSLYGCAKIINSLAQVNTELNILINDPNLCLKLIKHLADRFNCSDLTAATALQTKEAKRRVLLQTELFNLCHHIFNETVDYHCLELQPLLEQGIDLEFTYDADLAFLFLHAFLTPLMIASLNNKPQLIDCLLQKGSKVNQKTNGGKTALIVATESPHTTYNIIEKLLRAGANPTIADDNGNTALTNARRTNKSQKIITIIQDAATHKKHSKK